MTTNKNTHIATVLANLRTTSSGYDLIRYVGLPEMLGEEADLILYVLGKNLARHSDCATMEEVKEFFLHAGWGELHVIQEKRRGFLFELKGDIVEARLQTLQDIEFKLEVGFLAESVFRITGTRCEGVAEIKKNQIFFHVLHN